MVTDEPVIPDESQLPEKHHSDEPLTPYKQRIKWPNLIALSLIHLLGFYGLVNAHNIKWQTFYFTFLPAFLAALGIQAGAHRLWSHRSYKANFGVRLFLAICHVMSLQFDLYDWTRDHRGHHKWVETDADPHDSRRGLFFSHIGWLLVNKHPEVIRRGKTLDLSDIEADPVVQFQRRFYFPLAALFWFTFPVAIPVYFWDESLWYSILYCVFTRQMYTLNSTFLVNSVAHTFGNRPYDRNLAPTDTQVRHILNGEGFHNYHHAFPWDYSTSELGPLDVFNPVTAVIDLFHFFGWTWDLRKVKEDIVERRIEKSGDKSAYRYNTPGRFVVEWLSGLATFFGPMMLVRYSLMWCR